jgi:hypothetical protein
MIKIESIDIFNGRYKKMDSSSTKYNCKFCTRDYKEKFNYDRHIGFCEFTFKSKREVDSEIEAFDKPPTLSELFGYVKELSVRVNKLEKENALLKQFANKQKKRIDILDWLNNRYDCVPDNDFTIMMTSITVDKYLEQVFEYDLLTALIKCFDDHFENLDKLPIRAFQQKANTFYVYDKCITETDNPVNKWHIITNKQFNKWLNYVAQKFVSEFKTWHEANKEIIDRDESMKERYYDYFQKVLGGKMSDETRNQRLRQVIYSKLKQNLKNVIEFEFA